MKEKIIRFFKKETVLCVAMILTVISMFFIPPDEKYLNYIDFRTLSILFCLMIVVAGLQKSGVFQHIAELLLDKVNRAWQLALILVLLCFFSSMLITNDVSLLTFVPLTLVVLGMAGPEIKNQLIIPVIVLQTIAANLGSMLLPTGNPHNLYLYSHSGISMGNFIWMMLPYSLLSLGLILLWIAVLSRRCKQPVKVYFQKETSSSASKLHLSVYGILLVLALLTVAKVIPYLITLIITIAVLLIMDRSIFKRVDYYLLLTFVGFFIFIGNMERIPELSRVVSQVINGHEILVGVATSQIISNVPATLLLSRFTDNVLALAVGVNIGGLGTLIASMASLISYRMILRKEHQLKGAYFRYFTAANVFFLLILVGFSFIYKI